MNAQEAVRQQLGFWHGVGGQVLGDCGDALNSKLADAKVGSIASIYAHAVFAEDGIVNGMFQAKPLLFAEGGWAAKTGITPPNGPMQTPEWAAGVDMDLAKFQDYAKAVFAQTDAYLAALSDAEMERKIQGPVGETTIGWFLVNILGTHFPQHTGEIAALKGVQGLKGLPF
jgi:DinB family protein